MFLLFRTRVPDSPGEKSAKEELHTQVAHLPGEKSPEEVALEMGDDFEALQKFRLNWWEDYEDEDYENADSDYEDSDDEDSDSEEDSEEEHAEPERNAFAAFLHTEESLRKICQQEIALKKQPETPSKVRALKELSRDAWFLEREWRYLRSGITAGPSPLQRGFEQWRSDPRWYMHRVLVEDCVNRGGCCGRSCGCCLSRERETSSIGELGIGHCTVECACCCNARGFELTTEEKNTIERRFGFLDMKEEGIWEDYGYQQRLYFASIWGLLRNASVFDVQHHLSASAPIFQLERTDGEAASAVADSKTLLIDDPGEESDLTIIGSSSV